MKSMDLTRIMQISSLSRLQEPFPAPTHTKNIQKAEFQAIPKLHPSDPLYHNEIISNFEVFGPRKADIQCADEGIKVISPKFGPKLINLSILDVHMQNTYTLQATDPRILSESCRPCLLGPPK